MVGNFGFLGGLETKEFVKREEVAVTLGAGPDGNAFGHGVVLNERQSILTDRTAGLFGDRDLRLGQDGIDVFGGIKGDVVSDPAREPVAAAIETFTDLGGGIGFGIDGDGAEGLTTKGTEHETSIVYNG